MKKSIWITLIGVITSILIVGSVIYLGGLVVGGTWPPGSDSQTLGDSGAFGDSFGVLTSLFSGLAFLGIVLTVLLQKGELELQRHELSSQHKTAKIQSFESTFFEMLRLHNDIVNSIDLHKRNGGTTKGRDCFNTFYRRLDVNYRNKQNELRDIQGDKEILKQAYSQFWENHQTELGHYYRYLFNLIRFVDNSEFSDGPYIRLVRAQLSDQELLMLFYNCLSKQGAPFAKYIEKYSLLDNMPSIRLLNREHCARLDSRAFQSPAA